MLDLLVCLLPDEVDDEQAELGLERVQLRTRRTRNPGQEPRHRIFRRSCRRVVGDIVLVLLKLEVRSCFGIF